MILLAETATAPTSLDLITLVIAVVGLLAAMGSLAWQIFSWRLTGSKVKVAGSHGFTVPDASIDVLIVTAANVGRTPVAVDGWGFELPNKSTLVGHMFADDLHGPRVPITLAPGHSETWRLEKGRIINTLADTNFKPGVKLRPFVSLGTGKKAYGKAMGIT